MLTLKTTELSSRLTKTDVIKEIDDSILLHAEDIFNDFKNRGIILNGAFVDDLWIFSDERRSVGIPFVVDAVSDWVGCTAHVYSRCVKTYLTFQLGRIGLIQMQNLARILRLVSVMSAAEAYQIADHVNHVSEFLKIIPSGCGSRDVVIEALEERSNQEHSKKNARRALADFKSYLRFDEAIDRFWSVAGYEQRIEYFPLFFWWKLTAILPLRPTEFLLTPRDCLQGKVLTVRRTRLKNRDWRVNYSIEGDYELYRYEISDFLAAEIQAYKSATGAFKQNGIDTLLVPTNDFISRVSEESSRYYTYGRLRQCLRDFIGGVVTPSGTEIGSITLGDTRHLAMINLIISGGSPSACRDLAGHADIDISSHYYANISNLVECATLEHLRKSKSRKAAFVGKQQYSLAKPQEAHRVQGGLCDALGVENGDVSECLKVISSNGHIGECTCCSHYWPDKQGLRLKFYDKELGKQRVDADTEYLLHMVEVVRRGIGHSEDIGSAILRLQQSCAHYYACVLENIEHGKT